MPPPKVSVFIPCYNYAHYVGRAIESVLAQTNGDLELIVVDNGSTDDSWQVIQSYQDPRIKTFQIEKNEGVVKAWAFGLEQCRGEWFSLLPADDYLASTKHEILLKHLTAHPEVDVIGGYVAQVDENGRPWKGKAWMEDVVNAPRDYNDASSWMMRHYLCIPASLYRRRHCTAPSLGVNAVSDYDFHVRLLRRGCRFAQIKEVVSYYRWHTTNTSGSPAEQSTAPLQFAYCFATQFLPYLRESGQADRITDTIKNLFDLYHLQIRSTSPAHLKGIMLCIFWPDWVAKHVPDYNAFLALDWESNQEAYHFMAAQAMTDASFLKWVMPSPTTPPPGETETYEPQQQHKKRRRLGDVGRKLERSVRHFLRGKKA